MEVDDCTLMARYAHGDRDSFDELYRRYERRVFGFFLQRTRSQDRAAELFQEAFLRLHRFRDTYDPDRPFSSWLFQIARNVLNDDFRRMLRMREVSLSDHPEPSRSLGIEETAGLRQELALVFRDMSIEQAQIVVAAKVGGVPYATLAADLGRSVASVRQIASRTLRRMHSTRIEQIDLGDGPPAQARMAKWPR